MKLRSEEGLTSRVICTSSYRVGMAVGEETCQDVAGAAVKSTGQDTFNHGLYTRNNAVNDGPTRANFRSRVQCLKCLTTTEWSITLYLKMHRFIGVIPLPPPINHQPLGLRSPGQRRDPFPKVMTAMTSSQRNHPRSSMWSTSC